MPLNLLLRYLTRALRHTVLPAAIFALLSVVVICPANGEDHNLAGFNPADYRIRGITIIESGAAGAQSIAIIESVKTRNQGVYRQGDSLFGARITKIIPNSVTLSFEKKEYVLHTDTQAPSNTPQPQSSENIADQQRAMPPPYPGYTPPRDMGRPPNYEDIQKQIEEQQRLDPRL